VVWSNGKTAHC